MFSLSRLFGYCRTIVALTLFVLAIIPSYATPVSYKATLNNVVGTNGATFTGFFTYTYDTVAGQELTLTESGNYIYRTYWLLFQVCNYAWSHPKIDSG